MTTINPQSKGVSFRAHPLNNTRKILRTIGRQGNDAAIVAISTSVAGLLIRPSLILLDKNAKSQDKQYAACWNVVLSSGIIAIELLFLKDIKRFSHHVADKFFTKRQINLTQPQLEGAANWIKFTLFRGIVVAGVILNTRYLGRLLDTISFKLTGKNFTKNPDKNLTHEQIKKTHRIDNFFIGTLGLLGGMSLINILGRKFTGRSIASEALTKAFKRTHNFLETNSPVYQKFSSQLTEKINHFAMNLTKDSQTLAKEANQKDEWIVRNMLFNAVVRPIITLIGGQPYLAVRTLIEELFGAAIVKKAGSRIIDKSTPHFNKIFKPLNEEEREGVKVITGQVVRNILLLNIVSGLLNNAIDTKLIRFMQNKFDPQSHKSDFKKKVFNTKKLKDDLMNDPLKLWIKDFEKIK